MFKWPIATHLKLDPSSFENRFLFYFGWAFLCQVIVVNFRLEIAIFEGRIPDFCQIIVAWLLKHSRLLH